MQRFGGEVNIEKRVFWGEKIWGQITQRLSKEALGSSCHQKSQSKEIGKKVFYDQELSQRSLIASNSSGACDPVV